ncbi:PTS sugar transporter subunit IIA [Hyphomicrobiales bacterium]|jgi:PTS system mannose-specific IIA component|nr:PTS sugar transporter subunit IIA [Hyphomicrobiales bacterium]MDA9904091.1 PTS sugar transporter subunit IIA [Hyphomicrobiales bacterium]
MIGIIIVTHGNLALELKSAMEHILGVQKNIEIICISSDDDLDERKNDIKGSIKKIDNNNGIVMLTDMFGGTPSNLAISFLKTGKIEIISGVNLPMLVKLIGLRDSNDLNGVAQETKASAQKYISIASEILSENNK